MITRSTRLPTYHLLAALLITAFAQTSAHAELSKSDISAKLQEAFASKNMVLDVRKVEKSPIESFYQVITDKGLFYVNDTGEHIFSGSLLSVSDGMKNLTQTRMAVENKIELNKLRGEFLTYRAPNEKHEILVFYDTTCGYCNKLHGEIAQYNALGITVHYAAYPRSGVIDPRTNQISQSTQQLASIWCAPDDQKHQTFEMVTRRQPVPASNCDHSIEEQYKLGQILGVEGTPAVFDMDANLVARGYMPAQAMLNQIENRS